MSARELAYQKQTGQKRGNNKAIFALMLLTPLFLILAVVSIYPLLYSVWTSFTDFRLSRPNDISFVGLANYAATFVNPEFLNALKNSLIYAVVAVPIEMVFGLGIAIALNKILVLRDFARTLIVIPMMLAPVVMGLMWKFMFNDQIGIINHVLRDWGWLKGPLPWLTDSSLAMVSLIIVEVWATTPFMVILLGAGLTTISAELYEAARIDGATSWQCFVKITLPMLSPIILVALLIRGMDAFRVFDVVFTLTAGGPARATDVLSYYLYRETFINLDAGLSAAGSFLMLGVLMMAGIFLIRGLRKDDA